MLAVHGLAAIPLLLGLWIYEGFALKFLDQVVDEGRAVSTRVIWVVMLLAGASAGLFMAIDAFTGGSVLALCLGMIAARKIDARFWVVQIGLVLGSYVVALVVFSILSPAVLAGWMDVLFTFMIVFVFSVLDEVVHELSEKHASRILHVAGEWRVLMKVVVVVLVFVLPFVEWYHAVAWLCFDATYELTARRGFRAAA